MVNREHTMNKKSRYLTLVISEMMLIVCFKARAEARNTPKPESKVTEVKTFEIDAVPNVPTVSAISQEVV